MSKMWQAFVNLVVSLFTAGEKGGLALDEFMGGNHELAKGYNQTCAKWREGLDVVPSTQVAKKPPPKRKPRAKTTTPAA